MRPERVFEPLLPFEDLVTVNEEDECYQEKDCETNASEDCNFPDPCALLHITSRRKAPLRKQSPAVVCTMPLQYTLFLKPFAL